MLKGFKEFIMRGNVIDLAVGVVIGAAFTAIVTAFTDSLLEPLLNTIGGAEVTGLGFEIISGNPSTYLDFAAVITAVINFLLVALAVYFCIVVPMNKMKELQKKQEEEKPAEPTDVELLGEIRDLLAARNH